MRPVFAYLLAVASTYLLATTAATLHVMARLRDMNMAVAIGDYLRTIGHDLAGMLTSFLPLIAIGLLIALPVASGLARRWTGARAALFVLAGAVAMIAIHLALETAFDINAIAASRSTMGLLVQGLCGAFGGWLFVLVNPAMSTTRIENQR